MENLNDNLGSEETLPKKKRKNEFAIALHSNEKIIDELSTGYLFHVGDGNVKYRSYSDVEKYLDENELHAREVKNQPVRYPAGAGR